MPFVVAALVLVGSVAFLDLVVTFAVIRRLRTLESADPGVSASDPAGETAPEGLLVGEFVTQATDGSMLDWSAEDHDGMLFGFFSTACPTCWRKIPEFIGTAGIRGLGRRQVVAVVVGPAGDVPESVAALERVGRVVIEDLEGPVASAFGVIHVFPRFVLTDRQGRVAASSAAPQDLAQAAYA
jgi:redoxin